MAAALASARLDTTCWVATSTGPLLVSARRVDDRICVADAVLATMATTSTTTPATDHRR